MFKRVGKEQPGPMFYLVYEITPAVWSSVAYWSVLDANRRRHTLESAGRMAFVEAR